MPSPAASPRAQDTDYDHSRRRLFTTLALNAVFNIAAVGVVFYTVYDQRFNARTIDVAGRESTLSQSMTLQALALSRVHGAETSEVSADLRRSVVDFQSGLDALEAGSAELGVRKAGSAEVRARLAQLRELWQPFHDAIEVAIASPKATSPEYLIAVQYLRSQSDELLDAGNRVVQQLNAEAGADTTRMIALVAAALAINLILAGLVGGLARTIGNALGNALALKRRIESDNAELQAGIVRILDAVARAADGDFTVRAPVTDGALGNIADAFNQMMESIGELVKEISGLAGRVNSSMAVISDHSREMVSGATEQADRLGDTSQLLKAINLSIAKVSEDATIAASAAKRTQESAHSGSDSVQNVVAGMDVLRANVQAGAKKVKILGDRSMEITAIVGTIAKIAEQTNMLALNAAIEAARAGEHGRGFSVVAEQVRLLAERAAAATQEIEKLVKTIQVETNESVQAIEQQTQVVEEEAGVVARAGDALVQIQEVSTQSAELVTDISQVARQQVESANQAVRTVEQVGEIARRTMSGAQRSLGVTDELTSLSKALLGTLGRFKL
jgi:methyl-accepting chemotaxis protein